MKKELKILKKVEIVKYKRVKGHYKIIYNTKGKCKKVYVRPHLRKVVKNEI